MSNPQLDRNTRIGVLGAGTMGRGIAQIAATFGHQVLLYDTNAEALEGAAAYLDRILHRLVEKGRLADEEATAILGRIRFVTDGLETLADCGLVIEAIIEDLTIKQSVFEALEAFVVEDCVLATNTSSLSVTSIAAACSAPGRVLGIHFLIRLHCCRWWRSCRASIRRPTW